DRLGPDSRVEFRFRDHRRATFDQEPQQVECLRREMDLLAVSEQQPCLRVERVIRKYHLHGASLQKSWKSFRTLSERTLHSTQRAAVTRRKCTDDASGEGPERP